MPTVADRIAQTVVKTPGAGIGKTFPSRLVWVSTGKDRHRMRGEARQRCWHFDWVVDLDIKGFFDNLDRELMMRAVRHHTEEPWVVLYWSRWLAGPRCSCRMGATGAGSRHAARRGRQLRCWPTCSCTSRSTRGCKRNYPAVPFERYADDALCHCRTREEAERPESRAWSVRLAGCRLELHPEKTKIVYCKDDDRRLEISRLRLRLPGLYLSPAYARRIAGASTSSTSVRRSAPRRQSDSAPGQRLEADQSQRQGLDDLARMFNAIIRGWVNYYSAYYKSALYPILRQSTALLARWATRKFKRLRGHRRRAAAVAAPRGASNSRPVCALAHAVWAGWIGRAG